MGLKLKLGFNAGGGGGPIKWHMRHQRHTGGGNVQNSTVKRVYRIPGWIYRSRVLETRVSNSWTSEPNQRKNDLKRKHDLIWRMKNERSDLKNVKRFEAAQSEEETQSDLKNEEKIWKGAKKNEDLKNEERRMNDLIWRMKRRFEEALGRTKICRRRKNDLIWRGDLKRLSYLKRKNEDLPSKNEERRTVWHWGRRSETRVLKTRFPFLIIDSKPRLELDSFAKQTNINKLFHK